MQCHTLTTFSRQLRCDVIQDPWRTCTRCVKHKLECRIDSNFKRVGKRSRYAELEREKFLLEKRVKDLEKRCFRLGGTTSNGTDSARRSGSISEGVASPISPRPGTTSTLVAETANLSANPPPLNSAMYTGIQTNNSSYLGSHEAVATLLDLKQGLDGSANLGPSSAGPRLQLRSLEDVVLAPDRVQELFQEFFTNYHEFMPLLDSAKSPDFYFEQSPLLFWTVIVIAARHFGPDPELLARLTNPYTHLVWSTMSKVPQNYHVVKALCLLCTWPLPTSSTSSDPTFMFSGLMMKIAKQVGLHRPSHAQDFFKTRICLSEDDVNDMLTTWACCNIVAQNISTGFGQPPEVVFDTALDFGGLPLEDHPLPPAIAQRLELEKLCNRITLNLYTHATGSNVLWDGIDEPIKVNMFGQALLGFEKRVNNPAKWLSLHIRAVDLHLRLHTLVDPPSSPTYLSDLNQLYKSTIAFLDTALDDQVTGLKYASAYIMQMMLAAGFSLMRLLNSFFVRNGGGDHTPVDCDVGRHQFYSTVHAIRNLSVIPNDLPQRLAEVLVQLWKAYGGGLLNPDVEGLDAALTVNLQAAAETQVEPPRGVPAESKPATVSPLATILNPGSLPASSSESPPPSNPPGPTPARSSPNADINSLQLGVRNRMSMSLLYDSVWRWRDEIRGKIRSENLEAAVQNPTSPEMNAMSGSVTVSPLNVNLHTPVAPPTGVHSFTPGALNGIVNGTGSSNNNNHHHPNHHRGQLLIQPHGHGPMVPPLPMTNPSATSGLLHQTLSSADTPIQPIGSAFDPTMSGVDRHLINAGLGPALAPSPIQLGPMSGPGPDVSGHDASNPLGLSHPHQQQHQHQHQQNQGYNIHPHATASNQAQQQQQQQHHQASSLGQMFPTPLTSIDMFDPLSWFLNETAPDLLFATPGLTGPGSSAGPSSVSGFRLQ